LSELLVTLDGNLIFSGGPLMGSVLRAAASVVAALSLVCCSGGAPAASSPSLAPTTTPPSPTPTTEPTPEVHVLSGVLSVDGHDYDDLNARPDAQSCLNKARVHAGDEVLLLNESGTTIGKGLLLYGDPKYEDRVCSFVFDILNVPAANFYSLKIGLHTGPTWSSQDLLAMGWKVALTL
jgi:hypothetical protein